MKKFNGFKRISAILPLMVLLVACGSDDDDDSIGNWVERSSLNGKARSSAVSFVIDNKGYISTGYDGDDYRVDTWQYDISGDYWVQVADFTGTARSSAASFVVGGKGYVGTGYDGTNELGDFFKYDPDANSWSQVADFPDDPRRGGVGFAGTSYGFFGSGTDGDNDRKDFWKYDPSLDNWTEVVGFGGGKRHDATTFTIDNMVYFGTGVSNSTYLTDFWSFNTDTEVWTRLEELDDDDDYDVVRSNAAGFAINGYGYVACGVYSSQINSVWEYDPSNDTWEEKTDFELTTRRDPVAFSNGTQGYVLLGRNGTSYLDDMMEFYPFDEYDDED
ncbi:Kelch repeat-containing protein [Neptunitalea chrysea]|nr:kelch repeat-containing protein [Neptunitalea chrysea]